MTLQVNIQILARLESDWELHSGKLGPLRLRLIAATEEHVGAPFQQSKDSRRQDEQPLNRATKEDPDPGLLDRQRNREAASDHHHQAGEAVETWDFIERDVFPDEHESDDHRHYRQEI